MKRTHQEALARKALLTRLLIATLALAVIVAGLIIGGQYLEQANKPQAFGSLEGRFEQEPAITYEGKQYVKNASIRSYLFMGIDAGGQSGQYRNGGQSDFLMLLVIDSAHDTVRRIMIDRDTMAEITVLGVLGNDLGTNTLQICLSHGFGDGKQQSCQFTVEAVERLLYGIEVNGYYALNLDGITALNDLLGGVTVTLEDDFSALDPAMVAGVTLTLQGQQAELFVRSRKSVGDGTNAARMERQQVYLQNAMELILARVQEKSSFVGNLFDGLKDYLLTDISRGRMINEANKAAKFQTLAALSLPGEHTLGADGFVEFHVDEAALMQLVLDVFYTPVEP